MTFKRFVLLSIAVHAVVLLLIFLMPPSRQEKQRELVATLVTPEAQAPPPARKKSLPVPRARVRPPARPAPHPRMRQAPPPVAVKPPPPPPEEKPTVPGEGPVLLGKIHPPRVVPKAGKYGGKSEKEAGKGIGVSPRSFDLFDKGVTEEIARRDTGGTTAEEGSKNSPITMNTKNYLYAPYLSLLRQKIESIWVYPPEAARRGIYGDLQIRFTIRKDGSLGDVELVRTSGYKMLDDAAIRALKDGAPYWPLPDSWGKKQYTILGHFIYSTYGYEIQ